MAHEVKVHKTDCLDGTKGRWRPTLTCDPNGSNLRETAVVSCPGCGAQWGLGDFPETVDGVYPEVACYRGCGWRGEIVLEDYAKPSLRARFGRLKAERDAAIQRAQRRATQGAQRRAEDARRKQEDDENVEVSRQPHEET
jgi:hypothetical protein